MVADTASVAGHSRSSLRAVALPTEHGGWGLTAEPVLLGLLIAPSAAGVALGLAAFGSFVARTPCRVLLVDRHRGRALARTRLARRVLAVELLAVAAFVGLAVAAAEEWLFWWPVAVALPLVGLELWFDMRSRSRRLVPELAGAVGIGAVAAMIVLADGGSTAIAVGAWLVLAARAVTSIPHVRAQVARLHGRLSSSRVLVAADLAAAVLAALAVVADLALVLGALAVAMVIVALRVTDNTRPPAAKVIGLRQMAIGLAVVAITAAGVHAF